MKPGSESDPSAPLQPGFLVVGGEMGARIRAHDWSATMLGPPERWSQSLRLIVDICLNSAFPTAVYWGPELLILYNDAWISVAAEKHPRALGRAARDVWADIWDIIEPQFAQVMQTGAGFSTIEQLLPMRRNGRIEDTYWNYSFTPICDEGGSIAGVLNQGIEVTAEVFARRARQAEVERLRAAEEALRRLNEELEARVAERTAELSAVLQALQATITRMRTTFQTSFIYQGYLDTDGTLLDANAASLSGIQCKLQDVLGKPFWQTPWFTATPEMPDLVRQAVSAAARGETLRQTIVVNLPIGERTFDFSMRPVINEQGETVAIVPEAVEITSRVEMEEQLRQAQKMEAVGQLTGGIAHDFNNLLTGIIGSLDMMQARIAQGRLSDIERYAKAAMLSANRAAALTHRLLAFSRRQSLDAKPVVTNALITGMEEMLRRTLGESVQLEIAPGSGLWLTYCDPNQLESAILNLAINARDAMPEGGQITIETSNATLDERDVAPYAPLKAGQYVCISVTDTGTGMSPEVMARVFEPFFTTKPLGQGTGLGLSMIYGFVKQSEGHVSVDSVVGQGTTLRICLPRYRGEIAVAEEDTSVTDTYRALRGETVLVVEDEPVVRNLVREVLNDLGYQVIAAPDGAAGLKILLSEQSIDLLVTDIGLPELNGRQMVDAARENRPDLKVLFITGYAEHAMSTIGRSEPGTQMIIKPFAVEALVQRIREMIGR